MIQNLLYEKNNYLTLLFWVALGVFTGPLVYAAVPLHMVIIRNKGEWLWMLLGFWLILTVSDSRQGMFRFAATLKPIMMLVMAYLYITFPKEGESHKFIKPFIPFFIVAFLAIAGSPLKMESFQKTLSYLLLLLVIPGIVNLLLAYERDRFLYHLIATGCLVLLAGIALRFVAPGFVIFDGERFSGLLGNPNAIGIYGFLFISLFTIVQHFVPYLFSKKETIIIYGIIILAMFLSGSRGGIFSTLLFISAWFLIKHNPVLGIITMSLVFISYQAMTANLVNIIISLGLENYFRLETFETGSGRVVAREFGWMHIKEQYWWGKGFEYANHLLRENREYLRARNHMGNLHNSFLTMWLDVGLIGLIFFCWGWFKNILRAARYSMLIFALFFGLILSASVESWLTASLNPFTIIVVIILSLMANPMFYVNSEDSIDIENEET